MKLKKMLRVFGLTAILGCIACMAGSCSDDENDGGPVLIGKVTGVVTDDQFNPISGVTVTVNDSDVTATTNSSGAYTLENVSVGTHIITFTKSNYQTVSVTIVAKKFDNELVATVNSNMEYAAAKIKGTVLDSRANDGPLVGATVSVSPVLKTTTGNDGSFEIGNIPLANYTVTFEKEGYTPITRKIDKDDFVEGVATVNVRMGGREILRGLTVDDLKEAEKWYYNEYRGGRNDQSYPHWDWACNYMCTLNFIGEWEEQNEGTTIRIRNDESQRTNPVDLEMFDSFVYGSKKITEDNKIMTLQIRTHSASNEAPVYYGVQVVDLTEDEPQAVTIGDVRTLNSESYADVSVDLNEYIGKEVIIAIGTFRQQTGDYWKQLVLRRIAFAKEEVTGWGWLPGSEVEGLENWKLTMEMVRSTMPHTKNEFTGISPVGGNREKYVDGYRSWREVAHVGAEWSFMPLTKDPEVFANEGYLIKTRGGNNVSTTVPESYFYAKFTIAAGSNKLTLKTRNYSDNATFFKLTAIKGDGTVVHLAPESNTATSAEAAENGCWKFIHKSGDKGNPNDYAKFVYDLSQFNGEDIMLTLGVFKGEANGDENKLVIHSISIK